MIQRLGIIVILLIALALLLGLASIFHWPGFQFPSSTNNPPGAGEFDQSFNAGPLTVNYPAADFGLARAAGELPTNSYIPACESGFDYCLYYRGEAYAGTNFEKAGVRVNERADLAAERLCLETPPAGYTDQLAPIGAAATNLYSSTVFATGDAAAGHSAAGFLHRFYYRPSGQCYELETRVGQTQFANYPAGAIKEFTAADAQALQARLERIVSGVTFAS